MLCGVRNDLHPSLEGLRIVSIAGLYAKKERGKCLSLFLGQRGTGTNPSKSDLPVAGQSRRLGGAIPLFSPPAKMEIDPGHRHHIPSFSFENGGICFLKAITSYKTGAASLFCPGKTCKMAFAELIFEANS